MDHDLVLKGGKILLPGQGLVEGALAIRAEKISGILCADSEVTAREVLDVSGLAVLPGVIDAHVHLGHGADISRPREPADVDRESAAAASGGVTTFIPYVLSTDDFADTFASVKSLMEKGSRIDFGLHFVLAKEDHVQQVGHCVRELGIPSIKYFMNSRGEDGARLGLPTLHDGILFRLLEALADSGGLICPHPENIEIAWVLRDRVRSRDPDGSEGLSGWNATRPAFVEAEAVRRVCYLGRVAGSSVYTVHVSSKEALDAALEARRTGTQVFVETCVHYLLLDTESGLDERGKVNPPLRSPLDRDALWEAVKLGQIDTVATDHVHRPLASKEGGMWGASPGFPGMETLLSALLTEGRRRGVALDRLSDLVCRNPARIMGLTPRKGTIAIGADADLAIVDLNQRWTVSLDNVISSAGFSVFAGRTFDARVIHSFVRGAPTMIDLALVPDAVGTGRFCGRSLQNS